MTWRFERKSLTLVLCPGERENFEIWAEKPHPRSLSGGEGGLEDLSGKASPLFPFRGTGMTWRFGRKSLTLVPFPGERDDFVIDT